MPSRITRSKSTNAPVAERSVTRLARVENEQHALLILPKDVSENARIVSLYNLSISSTSRYYFCPRRGLYDITKIGYPKHSLRSCLITRDAPIIADFDTGTGTSLHDSISSTHTESTSSMLERGYILENGQAFIATPYDPVFLLTPLFLESESYFRPGDDHLDKLTEYSPGLSALLRSEVFKTSVLDRLAKISQRQDIGEGELVYKPQLRLLVNLLLGKATRSAASNWPASMEESLVQKGLELPIVPSQMPIQQDSIALEFATTERPTLDAASAHDRSGMSSITNLMRRRVALDFLLSTYIPPKLRPSLESLFKTETLAMFGPLEDHLGKVKRAKIEAQALRALSDNISRKRSALDDDEAAEARAEKKLKKEEEDKRKKAETRATKELKKVDTSGMKKLSSFFCKAAAPGNPQKTLS